MHGFKPDRAHYIRPDMIERRDPESTAVAFIYTSARGAPGAVMFSGKRQKPDSNYTYQSEASRTAAIERHREQVRRNEKWRAEQAEARKASRKADNSLDLDGRDYFSGPAVATILRQCLKEAFPGHRFSVTSQNSLRVVWTDGPSKRAVERIANTFAGSYFDGMIDYKGSIYHAIDGRKVRFSSDFVFCERTLSAEALTEGADLLQASKGEGTNQRPASITQEAFYCTVEINPDWPHALAGRWAGEYELPCAPDEFDRTQFAAGRVALESWFDAARKIEAQPSPTFDRISVLGSDGYGNTALPAADGGETGRGYPEQQESAESKRMREAVEQAATDLAEAPRVVAFAPYLVRAQVGRTLH